MKNFCEKHQEEKNPDSGICACCRNEKTLKTVIEATDYDGPGGNEDLETGIYDLVANLLHLAHDNGIDPDEMIRMGKMHFEAEVEDAKTWKKKNQRTGLATTDVPKLRSQHKKGRYWG